MWRATDLLLERTVAVKLLRPEYSDHPETLERFRKEAKNAGALNNPHVAQVYDYGPSGPGGSPYLVMEFVDGPSLADLLIVDPIAPAHALNVIAQAADGLAAAHKVGVIHRDIKPGNILISGEGTVKVTDFGIAHAAGQVPVTGPGLVMGTTQYMAPERIAGNPGTAASDLYALGIVLHECLTGVPPHDGTAAEVMAAHLYMPLPPLPASAPPELDVLVDRLTTKDPARRIADARELADLAARLRDAFGDGNLVPLARGPVVSGLGAGMLGGPAGLASDPGAGWASGGLAGGTGSGGIGGGPTASGVSGPGAGGTGVGGTGGAPGSGALGSTGLLSPADRSTGRYYVSDEWKVGPHVSRPAGSGEPGQPGQPGQPGLPSGKPRRRAGAAIAVGAAAAASAGLVALLVSGAFAGSPAANQSPAGSSTTGAPTTGRVPSNRASGAASTSAPGGTAGPSAAATPAATSQQATHGKKPSKSPSAHPASSAPAAGTSPSGGTSGPPTGGSTSEVPSSTQATSPAGTPSTPASPSPSKPSPSNCLLGICL